MRREVHSNYRIVVTPAMPDLFLRTSDSTRALVDDMATAIRRHVDHVGAVTITYDTRAECSHCCREWEVVTTDDLATHPDAYVGMVVGEPVCCSEASAEFRAQRETGGA